jgi:hypothetical protein
MAMTMSTSATHVAPLSPAASPRLSPDAFLAPGRNLKVNNGTQPADDHIHHLPTQLLNAWDEKCNRRIAPVMARKDFELLFTSVLRELGSSAAADGKLEAALAKRMQSETNRLATQLEQVKQDVFLTPYVADELDDLLPYVQRESHHGWSRYIIHTLSTLSKQCPSQQPATDRIPYPSVSPSAPTQPLRTKQRTPRIQKTRKPLQTVPQRKERRSERIRIKELKRNGVR